MVSRVSPLQRCAYAAPNSCSPDICVTACADNNMRNDFYVSEFPEFGTSYIGISEVNTLISLFARLSYSSVTSCPGFASCETYCNVGAPTGSPSSSPTTSKPSQSPSDSPSNAPISSKPSQSPTSAPSTSKPSSSPASVKPSRSPAYSQPSKSPLVAPTMIPSTNRFVFAFLLDDDCR